MDGGNGLICAYVLDGDGGATPLDWEGMANWKPTRPASASWCRPKPPWP